MRFPKNAHYKDLSLVDTDLFPYMNSYTGGSVGADSSH